MFSISFIFKPGTHDDEFRRLDATTQAVAEFTEGYLGSETGPPARHRASAAKRPGTHAVGRRDPLIPALDGHVVGLGML